jgi:predicted metal-binding protein
MTYNTDEFIKEAKGMGFSEAGELKLSALVFMPEVRDMCNVDRCHKYGKNWRCPPGCGSIEEAAERAAKYSYGIIVQTVGQMDDDFDYETIQATGQKHKKNFAALVEKLKERYHSG